jgi:hypothetical protein
LLTASVLTDSQDRLRITSSGEIKLGIGSVAPSVTLSADPADSTVLYLTGSIRISPGKVYLLETAVPLTPSSGEGVLYINSTDSKPYCKNDGGTVYDLTSAVGTVAITGGTISGVTLSSSTLANTNTFTMGTNATLQGYDIAGVWTRLDTETGFATAGLAAGASYRVYGKKFGRTCVVKGRVLVNGNMTTAFTISLPSSGALGDLIAVNTATVGTRQVGACVILDNGTRWYVGTVHWGNASRLLEFIHTENLTLGIVNNGGPITYAAGDEISFTVVGEVAG